jgi:mRNA interferase MazF
MAICSALDVVRVPFPFTDRNTTKRRPALVISGHAVFNNLSGHSVMAMITSSRRMAWPLDCPLNDFEAANLRVPSLVRFKLFTLDHQLILGVLGRLSESDANRVKENLKRLLSFDLEYPLS